MFHIRHHGMTSKPKRTPEQVLIEAAVGDVRNAQHHLQSTIDNIASAISHHKKHGGDTKSLEAIHASLTKHQTSLSDHEKANVRKD